jgi:hypothetical protein
VGVEDAREEAGATSLLYTQVNMYAREKSGNERHKLTQVFKTHLRELRDVSAGSDVDFMFSMAQVFNQTLKDEESPGEDGLSATPHPEAARDARSNCAPARCRCARWSWRH